MSIVAVKAGLDAPETAVEEKLVLHDFRTATDIARGAEGLDVQGFTFINHQSALDTELLLNGTKIEVVEETYAKEALNLALEITGAKRGIVHKVVFRRRLSPDEPDWSSLFSKGDTAAPEKAPSRNILVPPPQGPASQMHIDLSLEGLEQTLRYCRKNIAEFAAPVLEAQDRRAAGDKDVKRALRTVKRDPIAVYDWRSLDKQSDLVPTENRKPSEINATPQNQHCYCIPKQIPEEVTIIKFAASASEDPAVAAGCLHGSPEVPGTEEEETRCSVETRVYLFWE
ncbi:GA4 desaturase [Apiospora saccharicola]|uniref:GA4 desaturase n=1 Tax=Apiospora saccharicola TaxID=335842 RepID=A0ABR1VLV7_9PEZI